MKRFSALLFSILLCSQTVFALPYYVGQFYDGEAKPRAEVAWIWMGLYVYIDGIDGDRISISKSQNDHAHLSAIEVLPGKHTFKVSYADGSFTSNEDQSVEVDAQAGGIYLINGDTTWKGLRQKWFANIKPFTPTNKYSEQIPRKMVERSVSVDGVFESLKHGNMVLAIAEGAQTRSFVVAFYRMYVPTMRAGQKVRVIYFPSRPEDAVSIILTQ